MSSIRQVAKKAGVSIATVSRVINGSENVAPHLRRDVMDAVAACNYTPMVGRKQPQAIALIYTGLFTVGSPYDSACLDGMVSAMRESIYDLAIVDLRRDLGKQETLAQFFSRKGICGAIMRCTYAEREFVRELANQDLPLVVLGDHFEHPSLIFVYTESKQASRDAVEHLVSLGHTRIAFVACEREDGDHTDRLEAYCEVLEEHELLRRDLICRVPASRADGGPILRRLIGMADRPTAMYVADPLVAAGAINEAHAMGVRIPEDLSIIGFDDTDMRNLIYPRMSSVCQDSETLGRSAFKLVENLVNGNLPLNASSHESAWLEIHSTTAPPPQEVQRIMPSGSRMPA